MGIQNIYFRRSFKGLRRRRQIVFFWSVLIERARKTREGERRTPLLFPRRARASFHRSKKKIGAYSTLSKTFSYTCIPEQMSKSLPAETAKRQYGY